MESMVQKTPYDHATIRLVIAFMSGHLACAGIWNATLSQGWRAALSFVAALALIGLLAVTKHQDVDAVGED